MLKISKENKRYLIGFLAIFIIGFLFGYFVITAVNYYGPGVSVGNSNSFWQALLPL
ncbi:MAG: hypothetical protein AAB361_00375 [Patescibacteria group bacterium]